MLEKQSEQIALSSPTSYVSIVSQPPNSLKRRRQHSGQHQGPQRRVATTTAQRATFQASTTEVVATATRSNSTASTNVLPTPRVTVEGARRIWGTHHHATTKTIENAISRFCNVQGLRIKRKTSRNRQTQKTSRWFVIHAQESVLQELDSKWDALSTQTSWTLKQCTKPQDIYGGGYCSNFTCNNPGNGAVST